MGIIKGKSAIHLFKTRKRLKEKPYWGNHFWVRGYFVTTVGVDEDLIRRYIQHQEKEEKKRENESQDYRLFLRQRLKKATTSGGGSLLNLQNQAFTRNNSGKSLVLMNSCFILE